MSILSTLACCDVLWQSRPASVLPGGLWEGQEGVLGLQSPLQINSYSTGSDDSLFLMLRRNNCQKKTTKEKKPLQMNVFTVFGWLLLEFKLTTKEDLGHLVQPGPLNMKNKIVLFPC